MSHALSDIFGEATLFHLDHTIYHAAVGIVLYRMHDDILFKRESLCEGLDDPEDMRRM